MRKVVYAISIILLINLIVGYLFQLHKQVFCFPELMILCLCGLIFWTMAYKPLQFFALSLNGEVNFIKIGALGILITGLNFLFCFYLLKTSMIALFGCDGSTFQLLNVSLTNNITGNLLCYFSLVFLFINQEKTQQQSQVDGTSLEPWYLILADHQNTKIKVSFASISHITVEKNCTIIHSHRRKFIRYESLRSLSERLPQVLFLQIHRSTVVNIEFIEEVTSLPSGDGNTTLKNGVKLRYSRNYKQELLSRTGMN